eukprot:14725023-Heterocapsa_arctica.AAC.1
MRKLSPGCFVALVLWKERERGAARLHTASEALRKQHVGRADGRSADSSIQCQSWRAPTRSRRYVHPEISQGDCGHPATAPEGPSCT